MPVSGGGQIVPKKSYTPRELDVMSILWDLGSSTVVGVQERMDPLAYTTVLTLLRNLEEKGFVRHEAEGRSYRYYPTMDWRTAGRHEVGRLLKKVFKGSPELLFVQLISDFPMNEEQLRRARALVAGPVGNSSEG